jgi:hypothetical protein
VTFSSVGIKLETTDSDYDEQILLEWEISDIIYINCKWIGTVSFIQHIPAAN